MYYDTKAHHISLLDTPTPSKSTNQSRSPSSSNTPHQSAQSAPRTSSSSEALPPYSRSESTYAPSIKSMKKSPIASIFSRKSSDSERPRPKEAKPNKYADREPYYAASAFYFATK